MHNPKTRLTTTDLRLPKHPEHVIGIAELDGKICRSIDPTKIDPQPELGELPEFVLTVRKTFDG